MMKFFAVIILSLIFCKQIEPQNIDGGFSGSFNSYVGDTRQPLSYGSFRFRQGKYELDLSLGEIATSRERQEIPGMYYTDSPFYTTFYTEIGTYIIIKEGVYDYLHLNSQTNFTYKKKLGMLFHPRRVYLYDGNEIFFASDEGPRWGGSNPRITLIKTSSFLTENRIKYDASNFRVPDRYYLRPWVEGAEGEGIGEWIEITMERGMDVSDGNWPLDFFLISNGYVSFNNPALYERNNRIKKLRILCESEGIDFIAELEDTPQFQEIKLPRSIMTTTSIFRFVIEDVYKGSRWDDTCLNLIIPLGNQPR